MLGFFVLASRAVVSARAVVCVPQRRSPFGRVVGLAATLGAVLLFGCGSDGASQGPSVIPKDASLLDQVDGAAGKDGADAPWVDAADALVDQGPQQCKPKTCAQIGAECGSVPDGCGGRLECGQACNVGQLCGGGGPNKCGTNACNPKSCAQLGASCGYESDGCSQAIDCGDCPSPTTCGGGGKQNQCGCVPKSCAQLGASCGSLPDGCLGVIDCGVCPTGQSCGGGGPNKCGTKSCAAKTCAQLQASCGPVSDGCSAALDCGDCYGQGEVCMISSSSSYCLCPAKSCAQLGATCGTVLGTCGPMDCGACTAPDTCGGGGIPNKCGCTCQAPHALTACLAGVCSVDKCDPGWANCDADASNGCETPTTNDAANCGACGQSCALAHATSTCNGGQCVLVSCNTGYVDCDNNPATGCEVNAQADPNHCGNCSTVCPSSGGTAVCEAGICGVSNCSVGSGDCDDNPGNGCETNVTNSAQHCGFCKNPCSFPNATGQCVSSVCHIQTCAAGYGNCDSQEGNGCETLTNSSPQHCGSCGHVCETGPNGTATCVSGVCGLACASGFGNCDATASNGCETLLTYDPANCGSCGHACNAAHGTATCSGGQCAVSSCQSGWADCDGAASNGCEVHTFSDPLHCGSCSSVCSTVHGTASCAAGVCGIQCSAGWGDCDGNVNNACETDLSNDPEHCGTCATICPAQGGTPECKAGVCGLSSCESGRGDCDGNTANGCETVLTSSVQHCGSCNHACTPQQATPACNNGNCAIGSCATGWSDCNGQYADGCEMHTAIDPAHCGTCATVCGTGNGTPTCSSGSCGINCDTGWSNCDGNLSNGCEVFTNGDLQHCGGCTSVCSTPQATPACLAGACTISSCNSGWGDCDSSVTTGCEINLNTDNAHCGSCSTVCSNYHGTGTCTNGSCVMACDSGWGNCDNNASTGCEANLNNDIQHCGNCTTVCTASSGTPVCDQGVCKVSNCPPGTGDCDGNTANGCEANLNQDVANCGYCSNECKADHASVVCNSGVCALSGCDSGWSNCNGLYIDGCEVNTSSDPLRCGSCSTVCSSNHGTASCSGGVCQIVCDPNWGNCDGVSTNGCETEVTKDPKNCGTCGKLCNDNHGEPTCAAGVCGIVCDAGWENCDGLLSTGCEADTLGDPQNCGGCGKICNSSQGTASCVGGLCKILCDTGWGNCDGDVSNGCETNLTSDPAHCLSCTTPCAAVPHGVVGCQSGCVLVACQGAYADCDKEYSNGCEIDLSSNPANCGQCHHACPAGACEGSQCVPAVVLGGLNSPMGIQYDPTLLDLFFLERGTKGAGYLDGSFKGVSCPGCTVDDLPSPITLMTDLTGLYWTNYGAPGSLWKYQGGGSVFVSGTDGAIGITKGGAFFYWTLVDGTVWRTDKFGGTKALIATDLAPARGITSDDTYIFWAGGSRILRADLDGSNKTTLASGQDNPIDVKVDGANVYWTNAGASFDGTTCASKDGSVRRTPKVFGSPAVLSSGQSCPQLMVLDTDIYWANAGIFVGTTYSGDGSVARVPTAGGTTTTIASGQDWPFAVTLDKTFVYWSNRGAAGTGAILKFDK